MTDYIVNPSQLAGGIAVPSSKSQTLRAVLFGSLAKGETIIRNPLFSPDAEAMVNAFRGFGVEIEQTGDQIAIQGLGGRLGSAENVIDAGNSGIVFRFVSAVAALSGYPIVITGDRSLRSQRPIQPLLDGLTQLGIKAFSTKRDGYAPVVIEGPLKGGRAVISGEDSQPVSGLLIAGAFSEGTLELQVKNPGEKPWVQMTLDWFKRLGIECKNEEFSRYHVEGGKPIKGFSYQVPGDFSTAAFPIVAALITGSSLTLKNMDFSDPQGDKQAILIFQKMGGDITVDHKNREIHVGRNSKLKGVEVDINDFIDAITPLAVLGCFAEGKTVITNARVARTKECDRIQALCSELKKMGADIEEKEDGLIIKQSHLKGSSQLNSWGDHRMAMALSVAGLAAKGESRILKVDCIGKTYPGFLEQFRSLGAAIKEAV